MANIRFLKNAILTFKDGTDHFIHFGNIYSVDKLVRSNDNFVDIHFENGEIVEGISDNSFCIMDKVKIEYVDNSTQNDNIDMSNDENIDDESEILHSVNTGETNVNTENNGGSEEESSSSDIL